MKNIYLLMLLVFAKVTATLAQNIPYSSLYDNTAFNNRAITTSLAVGSTPGAGNVSAIGSASYSIPIAVPPGSNNVVPSVSLEYNSLAGSGIAGMGWNISGLSAISRVARNVYFDGVSGPVELSANDRFAMDGSRLIVKTGTYGTAGSTYATEVETFSTVTAIGTQGNGPLSFEVLTKEGLKMEFGNTVDSRFMSETGNTVMFWRISKIIYPDGNYVEYVYTDTSSERDSRISEIRYTGNASAGILPYNKIEFAYKVRQEGSPVTFSDIRTTYEGGSSILSKYLLDLVTVKAEGTVVKKYQLGYGHDNINSYLKSVTEFGSDNSQLNPTIFKYGDTPVQITSQSTTIPGANIQAFSGDFDGDGKRDILSASVDHSDGDIPFFNSFSVYKANSAGGFSSISTQTVPNTYTIVEKQEIPNSKSFIPGDFTGDGIDDILMLNISNQGTYLRVDNVVIYESKNGGTSFDPHSRVIQPNYNRIPNNKQFFYPGDFDGDGISEYISILGNSTGLYGPFICGNYLVGGACGAITISGPASIPADTWHTATRITAMDFNGDGKTDLMVEKNSLYEVFTIEGSNAIRLASGTLPSSNDLNFIGDFNGDGKTDVIYANSNFSTLYKSVSTGTTLIQTPLNLIQHWFSNNPDQVGGQTDRFIIGDYNGDGRSDIYYHWTRQVLYENPEGGGMDLHSFVITDIYYSQGDSFEYKQLYFNEEISAYGRPSTVTFLLDVPMDLNGDGRTDLVTSGGTSLSYVLFNKDGKENLLNKVANGLNHVTEWNYKSLVDNGTFYSRGTGTSNYPFNIIQPSAILVSEFKVPNGIGGTSAVQYNYEEARLHRSGKGFLGFKYVYVTDLSMGTKTVSENQFNTTYYTAVPYQTKTYLTSNSTLLNSTTLTNSFVSPATNQFWIKTTGLLESNNLTGRSVNTTNTYDDANGNITYSKMDVNSGVEITETTTVYGAFPGSILNKPTSVTIAKTRGSQTPAYSTVTTFGYNSIGQLTSRTDFSGAAKSVTTSYGYNSFGNLTSTTVTPSGMTARSSSSVFDTKGRYPESSLNALSQGSSATYDAKWGKPLTVTGIDGLTISSTYDGFGRTISTTYPGPYTTNQTYVWDSSNGAVWRSDLSYPDQGKPDSKTWYDLLGRQIRTETEGFGGTIIQEQTYDAKGNIKTSSQPYKSAETYITTTNGYHPDYNWLISVDQGARGATSMTYAYSAGALTLTTTAPTGITSKTTDASGKVISATDNGGTLTYSYYNHGGLNQVKKDGVDITSNEYDIYGRQAKLTDANAGITTYEYDALGQLTSQVNANGQTHTIAYNLLGQVTTRTGPEGTTSYIYGSSNSGGESKNQVKQITGFTSGNQTNYTYDAFGRVTSVTEKIDGTDHTTSYSYNSFGDVLTTTYPSALAITNVYDTNGYLSKIQRSSTDIYTTGTMNGQGQVLTYSLGNGKSSTNTYVNGFPTKFETSGIQDLNMVWDYQKGNLTSRNDARAAVNKTESFTYDNLNLLTGSTISGVNGSFTASYASDGNITTKTDAGSYYYDETKFNAVRGVSNPSTVPIPYPQQNISYTAFMQPEIISEANISNVPFELTYTYGADYERIKGVLKQNGTVINTRLYFAGGFEQDVTSGVTRYIQYISSPAGLVAIVESQGSSHTIHYTYTDHLGSIVTATNSSATVEAQQSFDAWGRRRSYDSWTLMLPTAATGLPVWLYRGYTGHEHLDQFGLINMNGRLYDPVLGRMLSPDNYIYDAGSTQDYNRYSYAKNNPLLYTDPDGNNPLVSMLIGAAIGGIINGFSYGLQGKGFLNGFWRGAITGAIGGLTGYYAPIGVAPGLAYGAGAGAITGGVGAALNGNNVWKGIAWGAALGGISGAISGGIEAHKLGANTWTGARPDHYYPASDAFVSGGTPAPYSDEYLYELKNKNWKEIGPGGRMTMNKTKLDPGYTMGKDGVITTPDKTRALAYTKSTQWKHGMSSKIFFGKAAFSSREQLASTMAHELSHVTFANSSLYSMSQWELTNSVADNEGHLAIYEMQNRLLQINGWQRVVSPYTIGYESVNTELYKLIKHLARPINFPR